MKKVFFPVDKKSESLPVGTSDQMLGYPTPVKTSPCIVKLSDKQVNFKHFLFKTSGLKGHSNRRVLIERGPT